MLQERFLAKAQQQRPVSPFEDIRLGPIDPFQRNRIKPFREWTEGELEGYNKRVQWYYDSYAKYLEQLKEYRLLRQRAVKMELAFANLGTRPATDVWAKLTFPVGVLVYEDDHLPKAPTEPSSPPLAPNGVGNATILQGAQPCSSLFAPPPRVGDDHRYIEFRTEKIQQGFEQSIRSLTVLMSTRAHVRALRRFGTGKRNT